MMSRMLMVLDEEERAWKFGLGEMIELGYVDSDSALAAAQNRGLHIYHLTMEFPQAGCSECSKTGHEGNRY